MSLLSEYEKRTAWKYEPVHGRFFTADGLKNKIADDGKFRNFPGTTVVFRTDATGTRIIQMMQQVLHYWLKDTGMLAEELPSETTHMTLHDLISPEKCISNTEEGYKEELKNSQYRAVIITEEIRKDFAGRKITMVADRIVNMVSKSIVLLLRPQSEQDYELLNELYSRYNEISEFTYPYTPHITLAYYKPGMIDGDRFWNAMEHAQIHLENAPVFEFYPESITVQTFQSMEHYTDIPRRICFCCDGGMNRSVLAANILTDHARKRGIPIVCEARSAYPNTEGTIIPQQVWSLLEKSNTQISTTSSTARFLEENEISHFSDFVAITPGALTHFQLMGIPEEKYNKAGGYFYGVDDPQYGAISYLEVFREIYNRVDRYLDSLVPDIERKDK